MIDGIIKADGTSRLMRAELPATYEEFRAQCLAGAQPLDILFNAVGWSKLPTFLNKANLQKDATAALFGLGEDAVPNDLFSWLGQYAQHWWSVLHGQASIIYKKKQTAFAMTNGDVHYIMPETVATTISYANSVSVDTSSGAVSLANPSTIALTAFYRTSEKLDAAKAEILGKYVKGFYFDPDTIYYVPASTPITVRRIDYYAMYMANTTIYKVSSEVVNIPAGETTYIHSTDRNAYPDSGTVDGLTYEYLGIPFQNAVSAPKIAIGSYTGTGTFGASNPCSLTLDFVPKLVIIARNTLSVSNYYGSYYDSALWMYGCEYVNIFNGNNNNQVPFSLSGSTLSWYSENENAQLNTSGVTYKHIAIG